MRRPTTEKSKQMEITREIAIKVRDTVDAGLVKGVGIQVPGQMCVEAAVCVTQWAYRIAMSLRVFRPRFDS